MSTIQRLFHQRKKHYAKVSEILSRSGLPDLFLSRIFPLAYTNNLISPQRRIIFHTPQPKINFLVYIIVVKKKRYEKI